MSVSTDEGRATKATAAALEASTVRISVLVTKEQRRQLKVMAASKNVTISEVVRQGIVRFIDGHS